MIIDYNGIHPDVSRAAFVAESAAVIGDVILEEGVSVWFGAVLRGDLGPIRIGKNSNVQDNCVLHCDAGDSLTVGENVTVGHSAILHGCTVGNGCMIGMGATVLNHVVLGDQCLVGANALVTEGKEFPAGRLIMGSPAKDIKPVSEAQIAMIEAGNREYVQLTKEYNSYT